MTSPATLLLKIALSPALVGAASLLMARVGPRIGGFVTALPVVTGPILLLFAIEQGLHFAAAAAAKTLVGTVALLVYTTTYVAVARARAERTSPWLCLGLGWLAFLTVAALLQSVAWPKIAGVVLALVAVASGIATLARESREGDTRLVTAPGPRLLLLRVGAAGCLVTFLSVMAPMLGPAWSGLLSAFPVVSTVMLVATHIDHGLPVAIGWLRGFYLGLLGYVAFVACIAYGLEPLGLLPAFGIGIGVAMLTQGLVNWATRLPTSPRTGR